MIKLLFQSVKIAESFLLSLDMSKNISSGFIDMARE